jgi:protein tyrosine phosphatase (PTP) superfamily phosphohydrolase (DUF442 family)
MMALFLALAAAAWSASPLDVSTKKARGVIAAAREISPDGEEAGELGKNASRPPTKVSNAVWRSSQLNDEELEKLGELGIKTILNLRSPDSYKEEVAALERVDAGRASRGLPPLGIEPVGAPMNGLKKPKFSEIDRALAVLSDPSKAPVLVHCKHGEDRTGVVVAAYRTEVEKKMTLDEAVAEAKSMDCCHFVVPGKNGLRNLLVSYRRHRAGPRVHK